VAVFQLNAEHRIGQGLDHAALDLYGAVLFGHNFPEILVFGFVRFCARIGAALPRLET
jgi:hypothetical protein